MPQFTVVAIWDPIASRVAFFDMVGFNFGLKSAVHQFNRYPALVVRFMRLVYAWCGTSYYDDFATVEPTCARGSGQRLLAHTMRRIGIPLSMAKHVPMAPRFIFLGVEAELAAFRRSGLVTLGVTDERRERIAATIDGHLAARRLSSGEAAKLAGRLGFTVLWAAGRFGRPIMRALFDRSSSTEVEMTTALVMCLTFFRDAMRSRRQLIPRKYRLRGDGRPTVRVWTDAAWEPDEAVPASVAFVVHFPGEWIGVGGARRWQAERWLHGACAVGAGRGDAPLLRARAVHWAAGAAGGCRRVLLRAGPAWAARRALD